MAKKNELSTEEILFFLNFYILFSNCCFEKREFSLRFKMQKFERLKLVDNAITNVFKYCPYCSLFDIFACTRSQFMRTTPSGIPSRWPGNVFNLFWWDMVEEDRQITQLLKLEMSFRKAFMLSLCFSLSYFSLVFRDKIRNERFFFYELYFNYYDLKHHYDLVEISYIPSFYSVIFPQCFNVCSEKYL